MAFDVVHRDRVVTAAHWCWRALTPAPVRSLLRPFAESVVLASLKSAGETESASARCRGPLVVSGFLGEALGIGRAADLTLSALRQAGLAPLPHAIRPVLDRKFFGSQRLPGGASGGVWLIHCNAPEACVLMSRVARSDWRQKYRIGYWAYETSNPPPDWLRVADLFDEIWTPSQFVADGFAGVGARVRVMPHPLPELTDAPSADPLRFGLDPDRFNVLCAGDMRSSMTRKNLVGAVKAYVLAFAPEDGATLTMKVSHGEFDSPSMAELRDVVARRPDIRLFEEVLTPDEMLGLLACSSLFFTPHRAEGFGLVAAEALQLGVPVLATGWSGNMEFMRGLDPLLIDYKLTPIDDPTGVYRQTANARWAEPDLADAARKLRRLKDDPCLARAFVDRGRDLVNQLAGVWSDEALARLPMHQWIATHTDPASGI